MDEMLKCSKGAEKVFNRKINAKYVKADTQHILFSYQRCLVASTEVLGTRNS